MKDLTQTEKIFLGWIREFYMDKYRYERFIYESSYRAIKILGIKAVEFHEFHELYNTSVLTISLDRPGLLIGKQGEDIKALELHLSTKHGKPVKIEVHQNKLDDYLLPIDYSDVGGF